MNLYLPLLLLFLLGINGCKNTEKAATGGNNLNRSAADNELLFRFEKTPCLGQCPVYEAEVYRSGKGRFNGKYHVEPEGQYAFWLPKAVLEHIEREAGQLNFFSLQDQYLSQATDFPSTFLTLYSKGKSKTVQVEGEAPEALLNLNQYIHQQIMDAVSPTKDKIAPDEEEKAKQQK